jgi:hypothetical protein
LRLLAYHEQILLLYLAFASIHTDSAILKNKSMNIIGGPIFEESQFIIKNYFHNWHGSQLTISLNPVAQAQYESVRYAPED